MPIESMTDEPTRHGSNNNFEELEKRVINDVRDV